MAARIFHVMQNSNLSVLLSAAPARIALAPRLPADELLTSRARKLQRC